MKNAIIFDLDGTLWDTTGCICDIWNAVLEKQGGIDFRLNPESLSQLMGKTMAEIGKILFPELSSAQQKRITDDIADEEVRYLYENGGVLYPLLEDTLKELSLKYDLYIVSNCQDGYVSAFLHAHKLEKYFKDIEMSGRTGLEKGDNIKLIMQRNNIKNAVYVGDTRGDENAAKKAGIPFIHAKYGFGETLSPDGVIDSLSALPELLILFDSVNF